MPGSIKILAIGVLCFFCCLGSAYADSININCGTTPLTPLNFPPPTTNLVCSLFNPSLGTLNSVTITLAITGNAQVYVDNDSALHGTSAAESFSNAQATLMMTMNGPGGSSVTTTASTSATVPSGYSDTIPATATTGPTGCDASNVPADGGQFVQLYATFGPFLVPVVCEYQSPVTSVGTASNSHTYTTGLGAWEGAGSFTFTGTGFGNYGGNAPPSVVTFGGAGNLQGTLTLEYDYTPPNRIPEPATLVLAGMSLVGLSLLARKRTVR